MRISGAEEQVDLTSSERLRGLSHHKCLSQSDVVSLKVKSRIYWPRGEIDVMTLHFEERLRDETMTPATVILLRPWSQRRKNDGLEARDDFE